MAEYIEKQAAIEACCSNCSESNICGGTCDDTDRIRNILTADVRPVVRGKWIKLAPYNQNNWKCSCCHKENKYAYKDGDVTVYELQDFFCPNCGADMRGGN